MRKRNEDVPPEDTQPELTVAKTVSLNLKRMLADDVMLRPCYHQAADVDYIREFLRVVEDRIGPRAHISIHASGLVASEKVHLL